MSTRSTIGIKRKDGTEKRIYCHWDGYIENNGIILQLAYNTPEKVENLLNLGNLSILGYYIDKDIDFDSKKPNTCVPYTARGEKLDFVDYNHKEEYNYTFIEDLGLWIVEEEKALQPQANSKEYLQLYCVNYISFYYKAYILLDRILEKIPGIIDQWEDDEFATKENLLNVLIQKAQEYRKPIAKKELDEYQAYYNAYCD